MRRWLFGCLKQKYSLFSSEPLIPVQTRGASSNYHKDWREHAPDSTDPGIQKIFFMHSSPRSTSCSASNGYMVKIFGCRASMNRIKD